MKKIFTVLTFLMVFSLSISVCAAHIPEIVLEDRDYRKDPIIVKDPETIGTFKDPVMKRMLKLEPI